MFICIEIVQISMPILTRYLFPFSSYEKKKNRHDYNSDATVLPYNRKVFIFIYEKKLLVDKVSNLRNTMVIVYSHFSCSSCDAEPERSFSKD